MNVVVIKILQGRVFTHTLLGRLTIYPPGANQISYIFPICVCIKNDEGWLLVDEVYSGGIFFCLPGR